MEYPSYPVVLFREALPAVVLCFTDSHIRVYMRGIIGYKSTRMLGADGIQAIRPFRPNMA